MSKVVGVGSLVAIARPARKVAKPISAKVRGPWILAGESLGKLAPESVVSSTRGKRVGSATSPRNSAWEYIDCSLPTTFTDITTSNTSRTDIALRSRSSRVQAFTPTIT